MTQLDEVRARMLEIKSEARSAQDRSITEGGYCEQRGRMEVADEVLQMLERPGLRDPVQDNAIELKDKRFRALCRDYCHRRVRQGS
jgi:hypothetical protein